MNKWFLLLVVMLLCGLGSDSLPVFAQETPDNGGADWTNLRPSLGSRLNHLEGVLKDKLTVRVVAYAPTSNSRAARFPVLGKNNKVAQLRLDNEPIDEPFTTMPHEFSWDTAQCTDGTHVLSVMLLDTVTRDTETLDKAVVTLNNGRPLAAPAPDAIATAPSVIPPPTLPRNRDYGRGVSLPQPAAAEGMAQIVPFEAEESKSDHPLMATATALCKANGVLYLGLKTGGIAACDPKTLTGWAVRPAAQTPNGAKGWVKSVCADKNNVYWTTSSGDGAGTVFRWDIKAGKATAYVLDTARTGTLGAVTLSVAGRSLTLADSAKRRNGMVWLLDTETGSVQNAPTRSEPDEKMFVAASGEDTAPRPDLFGPRYSAAQIVPLSGDGSPNRDRWQQVGPDIVAQRDETGSGEDAYLPWNGAAKDGKITAAVSDDSGLWIATDRGGVRHITPGKPDAATGYDGYVLVRLSDAPDFPLGIGPNADRNAKIASLVEEWQGTPYLWGGATKKGCDCSGFVGQVHHALGVDIPRSTDEMRASKQGERVHDELHYGDVLVYPGHTALYIGNGKTAETVGGTPTGSVSKSTIWGRREVAVRRYLR